MAGGDHKRVSLVPLAEEHVDQLLSWRAQPEAQQHQPIAVLHREQLLRHIEAKETGSFAELKDRDYIHIIQDDDRGVAVGWLTLEVLSMAHGLTRIGYTISKENWGQGYATAAVRAIARILFTGTPAKRIEADCSIHNPASRRVLEKCGFSHVGLKRSYLVIAGQRVDHYNLELTKDDWQDQ